MYMAETLAAKIQDGAFDSMLCTLYGTAALDLQHERYAQCAQAFAQLFGNREVRLFSTPGRTEICGNHTDHQHGRVLAAGVNLDVIGVAAPNNDGVIRIQSKGYPRDEVALNDLSPHESERNHACSLVRGVVARFKELGLHIGGFDAYTTSDVLSGSGLSSSAAFEVLIGTMLNGLFNDGKISALQLAQIGQYAENVYFGKPSGLMDQTAAAVGSFVAIDFFDPAHPVVEQIDFDFAHSGHHLCIVDTKGDHADLTDDYAAIPEEMRQVAQLFNKQVLREVDVDVFYAHLGEIYGKVSNRAIARAIHFFADDARVAQEVEALRAGDFERFKELVIRSGRSSAIYLQNLFAPEHPLFQGLTVALALSELILSGHGAWRVHGGGFAGTIQAFVPNALLETFRTRIDGVYGVGSCRVLCIRPVGACEVTE